MESRDVLIYFALLYKGDWNDIIKALEKHEIVDEELYLKMMQKVKCKICTIIDNDYPEVMKKIYKPPFVIFYYGDFSLLYKDNIIGVVGSREPLPYSIDACVEVLKNIGEKDPVIISGLALGIDTIAHKCALNNGYQTIAVLGSGIDYCYPLENYRLYDQIKYTGLIISEHPYKEIVSKEAFVFRNRLIAGLSKVLLIPEVKTKSGTLATIKYGVDFSKEILVIPHPIFDKTFNNSLIQEGAKITISNKDILDELK